MKDHAKLIWWLRALGISHYTTNHAADVIETLVKERDAARAEVARLCESIETDA